MKNAMKKLLSLVLVAVLLVSAVPFAYAAEAQTYTVTIRIQSAENGEKLDTLTMTYVAGDPCYAGKIVAYQGYEVVSFMANGVSYNADESFVVEADTKVGVAVKVAADEEETVPPTTAPETEPETQPETQPVTYTLNVTVYEVNDNEAKEWGQKSIVLEKNSVTLSELIQKMGYTNYESLSAKINGSSFEGRAAIAVEDGDQVDLFVTPARKGNEPDKNEHNKPSQKPSDKEEDKKPSKGEKVTLRVFHNDGTSNFTDLKVRTTDNLLKVINANAELSELERDGYELIGWAFEANNDLDKDWIAAQHTVADDDDLRVYADWQKSKRPNKDDHDDRDDEILLKIYVNGNTNSAAKVVDMAGYAKDGKITHAEAEKVVRKYYTEKYNDDDMDVDGLFTKKTWNNGDYSMRNAEKSIKVNEDGDTIIYVMVRDAQKISSGTADTSNPKTGDTIFMAVTVMALSATALAAVYVFSKKRAVK